MTVTLSDDEAYFVFCVLDSEARRRLGLDPYTNHMRERLLPIYREWHKVHPHEVHPPLSLTSGQGK